MTDKQEPASTSDGQSRSNALRAFAMALPPIPYSIGLSARVGILNDIATEINTVGGPIPVISRAASYDDSYVVQRINDISTELNTLGATPPLPIYTSLGYNAFTSVISNIVTVMASLP